MDISISPARTLDAGAVGNILGLSNATLPWLPPLHTGAEEIRFAGEMIDAGWVCIASAGSEVVGFIARDDAEIHALYVLPAAQGQSVGTRLLENAKTECERLGLWTYEANTAAKRFYRSRGFEAVHRTNGSDNDVGLPDIRYEWEKGKS